MTAQRRLSQWRDQLERAGVLSVALDGETYTIPALPARAWILAHLDDDPLAVFPGLLPEEDEDVLLDAVEDDQDPLTAQRCSDVGLAVLAEASGGWRWWEADRLIATACGNWTLLDGQTARRGIDLLELPLDRFLAAVYAWRVENATKEDREEFVRWLEAPPLDAYDAEDPDALEHEAESFLAVAGQLGAFGGG